jgi:hypothetical protein
MRTMSLRALHRDPPVDWPVQVTRDGEILGTFIPLAVDAMPQPMPATYRTVFEQEQGPFENVETEVVAEVIRRVNSKGRDRISVETALEAVGVDPAEVAALGPVAPAPPIGKHLSQDDFDAQRAARREAETAALKAKQKRDAGWLNKMPSTGRGGGA